MLRQATDQDVLKVLNGSKERLFDLTLRVAGCPTEFHYTGVTRPSEDGLRGWDFVVAMPGDEDETIVLDLGFDRYDTFEIGPEDTVVAIKGDHRLRLDLNSVNFDD